MRLFDCRVPYVGLAAMRPVTTAYRPEMRARARKSFDVIGVLLEIGANVGAAGRVASLDSPVGGADPVTPSSRAGCGTPRPIVGRLTIGVGVGGDRVPRERGPSR